MGAESFNALMRNMEWTALSQPTSVTEKVSDEQMAETYIHLVPEGILYHEVSYLM